MRISAIRAVVTAGPLTDLAYVRVEVDGADGHGMRGWGECSLPGKPQGVAGAVADLERLLLGADPADIEWCWQRMYRHSYWRGGPILTSAISGIDIALWDLRGRVLDQPVYRLIGGAVRRRIRLYANLGLSEDPQELSARARAAVVLGYRTVKFYPLPALGPVEGMAMVRRVVACCEAVRMELGDTLDFALDFHGRPGAAMAPVLEAAVRHTGPLWIEEPVLPETPTALARLAEKSVIPIAVGERLFTRWAFRDVLEKGWAGILQPDVANAGGISELVRIAAMAETYGVAIAPHNPNGPVQNAASLHLAAALQPFAMLEHRPDMIAYGRALAGFAPEVEADGCTGLPNGPGLGITVDEAVLERAGPAPGWIPESFRADGSVGDW